MSWNPSWPVKVLSFPLQHPFLKSVVGFYRGRSLEEVPHGYLSPTAWADDALPEEFMLSGCVAHLLALGHGFNDPKEHSVKSSWSVCGGRMDPWFPWVWWLHNSALEGPSFWSFCLPESSRVLASPLTNQLGLCVVVTFYHHGQVLTRNNPREEGLFGSQLEVINSPLWWGSYCVVGRVCTAACSGIREQRPDRKWNWAKNVKAHHQWPTSSTASYHQLGTTCLNMWVCVGHFAFKS